MVYFSIGYPAAVNGAVHESLVVFQLVSSRVTLGGRGGPELYQWEVLSTTLYHSILPMIHSHAVVLFTLCPGLYASHFISVPFRDTVAGAVNVRSE